MSVPYRHIAHQGPVLGTLGRIAITAATQRFRTTSEASPELPGPKIRQIVSPRSDALIDDFIRWSGGDVRAWKGFVPPALFPQWGFPLLGQTLTSITYPLAKVLNGGCRVVSHRPIPRGMDLHLEAFLSEIDDNGRRAILTQRLMTSSPDGELLSSADVQMVIPLAPSKSKTPRTPVVVPLNAKPISDWRIPADAGLSFACLTGDFNPIHWLTPYAKIAGFGKRILHGFGSLTGAIERIRRSQWGGDIHRPGAFEVRFTRPLKVPNKVCIYTCADDFYVGHAPGSRAYLKGHFEPHTRHPKGDKK
ncbi:MAG: MaoC/PaaZ C-terminal domain-containing protein [Myxococcota bacterium]|nr:MaoC/PaaZ C-terminal domain-containing protein [Myxococcota bacterium]